MRQKIFSASFWIFMICISIIVGFLVLCGLNELVLYLFPQISITVSTSVVRLFSTCFLVVGIGMMVTLPVVFVNILARGIQQGKLGRWIAACFGSCFVCFPLMIQVLNGAWVSFAGYLAVIIVSTIIGGGGEKLRIPRYFDR